MFQTSQATEPTADEGSAQDSLASLPGFAPRTVAPPTVDPLDPEVTTTGKGDGGAGSGSAPSLPIPAFFKQRAKSYGKIAEALFQAGGAWAHKAVGEVGEAFLPDDEDLETVPPPLGRIAARRIKYGAPDNLSDIEDIGMVIVGVVVWAAKGITAVLSARRDQRKAEEGRAVHTEAGEG